MDGAGDSPVLLKNDFSENVLRWNCPRIEGKENRRIRHTITFPDPPRLVFQTGKTERPFSRALAT
jgi:hypothetical protein